jgi:CDP-glucose 4,6-dehydratase
MRSTYAGKKVLVTGHTGFKGGWLSLWLAELGARVFGYALDPATKPDLFTLANVGGVTDDVRADVRDADKLAARVAAVLPDFIFHLAAQPIVRASYDDPVGTMDTNVMGTVHLLDAVRRAGHPCVVVVVTSDKCYANSGQVFGYRETDPLGGGDPYSASKACAEIVTASYAASFFGGAGEAGGTGRPDVRVASGRAGNVIGGGDFATDRLIPDLVRAIQSAEPLRLRHPDAVRPWQHVLEPLSGYLWLGARLAAEGGRGFAGAWNFGPASEGFRTVMEIATRATQLLEGKGIVVGEADPTRHEMAFLTLATDKARRQLDWSAVWNIDRAVDETMEWYRAVSAGKSAEGATLAQIRSYTNDAKARGLRWAGAEGANAKESA